MNKYLIRSLTVGSLQVNCYLLADINSKETIIIDPGDEPKTIIKEVSKNGLKPIIILNTHGHIDHIGANKYLKNHYNIPIVIHKEDADYLTDPSLNGAGLVGYADNRQKADRLLENNQKIVIGSLELKIIHTPGHTPGGVCVITEGLIFTGDTLFCGSIGRWDFKGGDKAALVKSLEIFKKLDPKLMVLPGHGPSSTLEEELESNPYLAGEF
ncbi:MAG: MBL fold metallo-hydrolase [Elusimicrobia bacterium]|nr:MBL fold metallo-hydrolase [Candidatus Liberimonas magnetica]